MSNFTFTPTDIPGVQIVDVKAYGDARGYFMETYKAADFAAAGIRDTFVQDNQSGSCRGVLRGLHFQKQHQQAKLVRAICGEIFDVAVDLRRGQRDLRPAGSACCSARTTAASSISRAASRTGFRC